jgi:ABC-type sugar transport system substrate-binding protein
VRVLYVMPLPEGGNPAIDAIGHGVEAAVRAGGGEVRCLVTDFREPDLAARTAVAFEQGVAAGVDAIVMYALDPAEPAAAAAATRSAGVKLFSLVPPDFPVDGAVVYPNFNHGLGMAQWLSPRLGPDARVGVIGGPDTPDDAEEVVGLIYGFGRAGVTVVNDATLPQWCNLIDVAEGGEDVARRLLAAHPDITALVPYNDETMLGTLRVLAEQGRTGTLPVISRNGSPAAIEMIRAGASTATWDLDATGIGWAGGALAMRNLTGNAAEGEQVMSPVGRMISLENIESWLPWNQRIEWNPLIVGFE